MLSLYYAQQPGYLLCIVFPSPCILQHCAKFNICTIVMLEKLLGVGSIGVFIDHLIHHQFFSCFFGWVRPFFEDQTIALAFLGCWALITPAFVTCY